jgi:hypothetical protein
VRVYYVFGALAYAALFIAAPAFGYFVESRNGALAGALVLVAVTFWLPSDQSTPAEDYRPLVFLPWLAVAVAMALLGRAGRARRRA